ncbi:MAG: hypothetical protein WCD53_20635 [Microcoleus sp.]
MFNFFIIAPQPKIWIAKLLADECGIFPTPMKVRSPALLPKKRSAPAFISARSPETRKSFEIFYQ